MEYLLLVPEVSMWLGAAVAFVLALTQSRARGSDTWLGLAKTAVYVVQVCMCVVALIVLNLAN